jgi:hypothetical protein
MNQEMTTETKELTWAEEHPWLAQMTAAEDDDSVDDVITASLSMNNLADVDLQGLRGAVYQVCT